MEETLRPQVNVGRKNNGSAVCQGNTTDVDNRKNLKKVCAE